MTRCEVRRATLGPVKPVLLFLLWLGGSATAVTVAWQGVGIVDDQVISPAPAAVFGAADSTPPTEATSGPGTDAATPTAAAASSDDPDVETPIETPTAGQVGSDGAEGSVSPAGGESVASIPPGPAPQPSSTPRPVATPPPVPAATAPSQAPTRPDPTSTARPQRPTPRPQPTATARPPRPTSTPAPQPTATPTATPVPQAPAQVLTFDLVGGTTSISFSAQGVEVLWATPRPGFTVRIDGGSRVRVEFRSDEHDSRIDAWWDGGPQTSVREED